MKFWIDDLRPAPEGFVRCKSVNEAKSRIIMVENRNKRYPKMNEKYEIEVISLDHDAGDFSYAGGDYIKLLDWLEETNRNYPIHIHSMNVIGRMNMEAICHRNGWTIVK